MKRFLLESLVCVSVALLSSEGQSASLAKYEFGPTSGTYNDNVAKLPSNMAMGITASDWNKGGGFYARFNDFNEGGKAFGDNTRWKGFQPSPATSFTLTADSGFLADYSALSFDIQMDSEVGTKIRRMDLTSSVTGSTVLYTLWNTAGAGDLGYDPVNHDLLSDDEWTPKTIDLSGVPELQNVGGDVTFTFDFDPASSAAPPITSNLRLDNVEMFGTVLQSVNTETKFTALDALEGQTFGSSVALSGSTALIGAVGDDVGGSNSGAAYLIDTTSGNELFKLKASDVSASDNFGWSTGISGNTAVVGARLNDDAGSNSGSAYLFNATTGSQLHKLTASDADVGDHFGTSVAISGNTTIVGARFDDDGGSNSGSAYLFDASTGLELYKLAATDADEGDSLGASVSVSGNIALAGAFLEDSGGADSGSAYLFDVATGNQLFKLTANDAAADDQFGYSVAISGNIALIGAPGNDDDGTDSGSAYLFDTTTGNQLFKLTADDATADDDFGFSVSISGDTALIGARSSSELGIDYGAAYLFDITTGNQISKFTANDAEPDDEFGYSVAISGETSLVGSRYDDDDGNRSGSAYLFMNTIAALGDFDLDGDVDGFDFLKWQREGGSSSDLALWEMNYGYSAASTTATITTVPEPGTLVLCSTQALLLGIFSGRLRRVPTGGQPTDV